MGVMLCPRMSMLPLPPSRPSAPSNLWTGVPLASKLVSTTNLPLLSLVVILPRFNVLSACCPTPPLLLRLGLVLTTSLTSCMPSVPSSTGMLEKVWKKERSLKLEKTWLLLRKIMKKLAWTLLKAREKKAKSTKEKNADYNFKYLFLGRYYLLYKLKNDLKTAFEEKKMQIIC